MLYLPIPVSCLGAAMQFMSVMCVKVAYNSGWAVHTSDAALCNALPLALPCMYPAHHVSRIVIIVTV